MTVCGLRNSDGVTIAIVVRSLALLAISLQTLLSTFGAIRIPGGKFP